MIDIKHLRYFAVTGRTLHFSRAAEILHITQPPLSRQIAALEKELGVKLLDRHPRTVTLTAAGRLFLGETLIALDAIDRACAVARKAAKGEAGQLTLGFMMHSVNTVVGRIARAMVDDYPLIQLNLREAFPSNMLADLLEGHVDAIITLPTAPNHCIVSRPIFEEELCCVLPADHAKARLETIGPSDLVAESFVLTDALSAPTLHATVLEYCRSGGGEPHIVLQAQLQQTIVRLVGEGIGIAIVPKSMALSASTNVALRPLRHAPTVVNMLSWRSNNTNPSLHALHAIVDRGNFYQPLASADGRGHLRDDRNAARPGPGHSHSSDLP